MANTGGYPFNPATGQDWPVTVYQEHIAQVEAERDRLWVALEGIRQLREQQRHAPDFYAYFAAIDKVLATALNR